MVHRLRLQNLPQTVSWSSWTKNGWNILVDWRLCSSQRHSPSQSRFSSQWLCLQPSLHQPVLLTTLSLSFNLNRPTTTHQQPTNQPANLHQQPAHRPKSDNQPSTTDQSHTDQVTKFAPSNMDTSSDSDSDSVVHELSASCWIWTRTTL